jgi:hypothetical protein
VARQRPKSNGGIVKCFGFDLLHTPIMLEFLYFQNVIAVDMRRPPICGLQQILPIANLYSGNIKVSSDSSNDISLYVSTSVSLILLVYIVLSFHPSTLRPRILEITRLVILVRLVVMPLLY